MIRAGKHDFDNETLTCQGFETVARAVEVASGLNSIIAIHDRTLGPALGGCRMWPYASDDEALADALRLARGMTFKSALAGPPFGGGCVTGDEVGIGVDDVARMAEETRHVVGTAFFTRPTT